MESKELVKTFYTRCLTVNNETNLTEFMGRLLADDFQSIDCKETKTKAQLIGQLGFFWVLVPNLKWVIQEMLQDGDQIVVRSFASGDFLIFLN